ncbi:MAG: iron-sulfur cluster repair di-iron protein [Bacteroidia bacterium]|nr:iron-sulfur cluster repair di-iron protein [Bacteroidia bacterium]
METTTENIINVTLIEPRLKHPTIFAGFDKLAEGENFVIHNDHDPKPLYYQLLGERGDIFTWEYLEQGPQWWKVRISKKVRGEGKETLGEIAAKDLHKAKIFKKYGLDFCCGGKKTVKEACLEKGLDVTKVEQELQQAEEVRESRPLPYNEWDPGFLADYIVNTHHGYINKNLPDIRMYANKVMRVHGDQHPELHKVYELVESAANEILPHMHKEEQILFPYIRQLAIIKKNSEPFEGSPFGTVENPIHMMEHEHDTLGNILKELNACTGGYTLPPDACASYSMLYRMLDEFENDLHLHIHLENNILFPKAIEMEKSLRN